MSGQTWGLSIKVNAKALSQLTGQTSKIDKLTQSLTGLYKAAPTAIGRAVTSAAAQINGMLKEVQALGKAFNDLGGPTSRRNATKVTSIGSSASGGSDGGRTYLRDFAPNFNKEKKVDFWKKFGISSEASEGVIKNGKKRYGGTFPEPRNGSDGKGKFFDSTQVMAGVLRATVTKPIVDSIRQMSAQILKQNDRIAVRKNSVETRTGTGSRERAASTMTDLATSAGNYVALTSSLGNLRPTSAQSRSVQKQTSSAPPMVPDIAMAMAGARGTKGLGGHGGRGSLDGGVNKFVAASADRIPANTANPETWSRRFAFAQNELVQHISDAIKSGRVDPKAAPQAKNSIASAALARKDRYQSEVGQNLNDKEFRSHVQRATMTLKGRQAAPQALEGESLAIQMDQFLKAEEARKTAAKSTSETKKTKVDKHGIRREVKLDAAALWLREQAKLKNDQDSSLDALPSGGGKKPKKTKKQLATDKEVGTGTTPDEKTPKPFVAAKTSNRILGATGRLAGYAAGGAAVYGVISAMRDGVNVIADFEKAMNDVRRVLNPLDADIGKLSQSAMSLGQEFGRSIIEVGGAMAIYAQQGRGFNDILEQTRTALIAANVTDLSLIESTESLTAAQKQFNLSAHDSMRILDAWNEVENTTAVNAKVLTQALKNAGTAVKVAGIDFDMFNGIVASVGEATRKSGSAIGTSMKFIFQNIYSDDAVDALQDVGINTKNAMGELAAGSTILSSLSARWASLTDVQKHNVAVSIAGTRHLNDFHVMLEKWDRANDIALTSATSQGSAMRENAIATDTLRKKQDQLRASYESMFVSIGSGGALSGLKMITDALGGVAKMIGKITDGFGTMGLGVAGIAAGIGAAGIGGSSLIQRGFWGRQEAHPYAGQSQFKTSSRINGLAGMAAAQGLGAAYNYATNRDMSKPASGMDTVADMGVTAATGLGALSVVAKDKTLSLNPSKTFKAQGKLGKAAMVTIAALVAGQIYKSGSEYFEGKTPEAETLREESNLNSRETKIGDIKGKLRVLKEYYATNGKVGNNEVGSSFVTEINEELAKLKMTPIPSLGSGNVGSTDVSLNSLAEAQTEDRKKMLEVSMKSIKTLLEGDVSKPEVARDALKALTVEASLLGRNKASFSTGSSQDVITKVAAANNDTEESINFQRLKAKAKAESGREIDRSSLNEVGASATAITKDDSLYGKLLENAKKFDGISRVTHQRFSTLVLEYTRAIDSLVHSNSRLLDSNAFNAEMATRIASSRGEATGSGSGEMSALTKSLDSLIEMQTRTVPGLATAGGDNLPAQVSNLIKVLGSTDGIAGISGLLKTQADLSKAAQDQRQQNAGFIQNILAFKTDSSDTDEDGNQTARKGLANVARDEIEKQLSPQDFESVNKLLGDVQSARASGDKNLADQALGKVERILETAVKSTTSGADEQIFSGISQQLESASAYAESAVSILASQLNFRQASGTEAGFFSEKESVGTSAKLQTLLTSLKASSVSNADRLKEEGLSDGDRRVVERNQNLIDTNIKLIETMSDLPAAVGRVVTLPQTRQRNINTAGALAGNAASTGLSGTSALKFAIESLTQSIDGTTDGVEKLSLNLLRQTAQSDLQARNAVNDQNVKGLRGSIFSSQMNRQFGFNDGGNGTEGFVEAAKSKLGDITAEVMKRLKENYGTDLEKLTFQQGDEITRAIREGMGAAGDALAEIGRMSDPAYRQSYLMASDSDRAMADFVEAQVKGGTSIEEIFADPRMRMAGQDSDLLRQVIDRGMNEQIQREMLQVMKEIRDLDAAKAANNVKIPGMSVGSTALAGTSAVDSKGRIRKNETPAMLHEGEIVLNKRQSEAMMKNKYAKGTMPGLLGQFDTRIPPGTDLKKMMPFLNEMNSGLSRIDPKLLERLAQRNLQFILPDKYTEFRRGLAANDLGSFNLEGDSGAIAVPRNVKSAQSGKFTSHPNVLNTVLHELGHPVDYQGVKGGFKFGLGTSHIDDVYLEGLRKIQRHKEFFKSGMGPSSAMTDSHYLRLGGAEVGRAELFADSFAAIHDADPAYAPGMSAKEFRKQFPDVINRTQQTMESVAAGKYQHSLDSLPASSDGTTSMSASNRRFMLREAGKFHGMSKTGALTPARAMAKQVPDLMKGLAEKNSLGISQKSMQALLDDVTVHTTAPKSIKGPSLASYSGAQSGVNKKGLFTSKAGQISLHQTDGLEGLRKTLQHEVGHVTHNRMRGLYDVSGKTTGSNMRLRNQANKAAWAMVLDSSDPDWSTARNRVWKDYRAKGYLKAAMKDPKAFMKSKMGADALAEIMAARGDIAEMTGRPLPLALQNLNESEAIFTGKMSAASKGGASVREVQKMVRAQDRLAIRIMQAGGYDGKNLNPSASTMIRGGRTQNIGLQARSMMGRMGQFGSKIMNSGFMKKMKGAGSSVMGGINRAGIAMGSGIRNAIHSGYGDIIPGVKGIGSSIKTGFYNAKAKAGNAFKSAKSGVRSAIQSGYGDIVPGVKAFGSDVGDYFSKMKSRGAFAVNAAKSGINTVRGFAGNAYNSARAGMETLRGAPGYAANAVKAGMRTARNVGGTILKGSANTLHSAAKSLRLGDAAHYLKNSAMGRGVAEMADKFSDVTGEMGFVGKGYLKSGMRSVSNGVGAMSRFGKKAYGAVTGHISNQFIKEFSGPAAYAKSKFGKARWMADAARQGVVDRFGRMTQPLAAGISNAEAGVAGFAKSTANGVVGGVKSAANSAMNGVKSVGGRIANSKTMQLAGQAGRFGMGQMSSGINKLQVAGSLGGDAARYVGGKLVSGAKSTASRAASMAGRAGKSIQRGGRSLARKMPGAFGYASAGVNIADLAAGQLLSDENYDAYQRHGGGLIRTSGQLATFGNMAAGRGISGSNMIYNKAIQYKAGKAVANSVVGKSLGFASKALGKVATPFAMVDAGIQAPTIAYNLAGKAGLISDRNLRGINEESDNMYDNLKNNTLGLFGISTDEGDALARGRTIFEMEAETRGPEWKNRTAAEAIARGRAAQMEDATADARFKQMVYRGNQQKELKQAEEMTRQQEQARTEKVTENNRLNAQREMFNRTLAELNAKNYQETYPTQFKSLQDESTHLLQRLNYGDYVTGSNPQKIKDRQIELSGMMPVLEERMGHLAQSRTSITGEIESLRQKWENLDPQVRGDKPFESTWNFTPQDLNPIQSMFDDIRKWQAQAIQDADLWTGTHDARMSAVNSQNKLNGRNAFPKMKGDITRDLETGQMMNTVEYGDSGAVPINSPAADTLRERYRTDQIAHMHKMNLGNQFASKLMTKAMSGQMNESSLFDILRKTDSTTGYSLASGLSRWSEWSDELAKLKPGSPESDRRIAEISGAQSEFLNGAPVSRSVYGKLLEVWDTVGRVKRHMGGPLGADETVIRSGGPRPEWVMDGGMVSSFKQSIVAMQDLTSRTNRNAQDFMSADAGQFMDASGIESNSSIRHSGEITLVAGDGLAEQLAQRVADILQGQLGGVAVKAPRAGDRIRNPLTEI